MDAIRNIRDYEYPRRKTSILDISRTPVEDFTEVVSLSEVKSLLRVDFTDDAVLTMHIPAARRWVEGMTGRSLVENLVKVVIQNPFRLYRLPYTPVIADSIVLTDHEGTTINENSYTIISEAGWPNIDYSAYGVSTIAYNAGYGDADVPDDLKLAVMYYVEYLYSESDRAEKALKNAKSLLGGKVWLL
jgi:uncharacterized phiE125 gp8 family phage protein